jgi:hypothetical protein
MRPIYEGDSGAGLALSDRLETLHTELVAKATDSLLHQAKVGIWTLQLVTDADGNLSGASYSRLNSEKHSFIRSDQAGPWLAEGYRNRFAEAHFYNLVDLATRQEAVWTPVQTLARAA